MNGEYPDYETYRALYARYYRGRDIGELLRLLDPLEGTRILDLCSGDGRLALIALADGAHEADIVDASPVMIPKDLLMHVRINVHVQEVSGALIALRREGISFDRIGCRQAVNYWLDEVTAEQVAMSLKPGGIFAFNTFNQKPSTIPRALEYEYSGHQFAEVSWLVGDTVLHVQVRDGMESHTTSFAWISPERFRNLLGPYFAITEERDGKTSLYRCEKK